MYRVPPTFQLDPVQSFSDKDVTQSLPDLCFLLTRKLMRITGRVSDHSVPAPSALPVEVEDQNPGTRGPQLHVQFIFHSVQDPTA